MHRLSARNHSNPVDYICEMSRILERFLEGAMNNRFKSDLSGTVTLQIKLIRQDVATITNYARQIANLFQYRGDVIISSQLQKYSSIFKISSYSIVV